MSTWVLLRGLMRESRHWGDFPDYFQHTLVANQVVTFDFPGNGSLYAATSPGSVTEMATHCRTRLNQLGIQPPYHVLALSLGAMVAVEWSRQHPAEFARLVLINTSLAPLNPFYYRLRPANYPALLGFLTLGSLRQREKLILHLTSSRKYSQLQKETLLDQWESYARECPVSRANILRQLYAAITFRASPAAPNVPMLLLAGQQDRLVNARCSIELAKRWGMPIKLHPTAGHDLPLDDSEWVARLIKEWVTQGAAT
jgi:pimeloyl-ACP methyl ester carboxylesterase